MQRLINILFLGLVGFVLYQNGSLLVQNWQVRHVALERHAGSLASEDMPQPSALITKFRKLKEDLKSQKALYYFTLGEMASQNGNVTEAIEYFKEAIKLDATSAHLYARLGEEYLKRSEFQIAIEHLKKAVELDSEHFNAHLLLGSVYAATKEYDKAEKHLKRNIVLEPENEKPYVVLSSLYSEQKKFSDAIDMLDQLLKIDSQSFLAHYYLGQIYSDQGRMTKAIREYKLALKANPSFYSAAIALGLYYETRDQVDQAVEVYLGVLDKGGSHPRLLRRAIQLLMAKKDYPRVIKLLEELKFQEPDDLNNRVRIGLIYFEIKEFEKAKLEFEELLKKEPTSDRVQFYLAAIYEKLEMKEKALNLLEKIQEGSTFYMDAVSHRVFLLRENKKYDQAKRLVHDALKKNTAQNQLYDLLASIYEKEEKYDEAIKILKEGIEKFPKEERMIYYLGSIYDKKGDYESAISWMEKILKLNPRHADAMNFIGYTYAMHNMKMNEAEKLIKEALKIKPGEGYIEDSLGWLYFQKGQYKKSLVMLEKAANLKPEEAVILEHLADNYIKLGKLEKAYEFYQKASQSNPDKKTSDSIQQKIDSLSREEIIRKRFPAVSPQ